MTTFWILAAVVCLGIVAVITALRIRAVYKAGAPWTFHSGRDDEPPAD